jgi:adenylate cyclase
MVDSSVVPLALRDLDALKQGEEKHITAFFSDIESSSVITEKLGGPQSAAFLNEYFSAVTNVLKAEGGTVDKYVGDGLVGIFGAPLELENDARAAARAALRMLERVDGLREEWRRRRAWCPQVWSLRIRIGLNSGSAAVGFFGTRDLASYTMTGPTVNVAKRLEQACRHYGVSILVGEATRDLLADEMLLRRLDRIDFNGRTEAVHELLGERLSVAASLLRATEVFEEALDLCDGRRWAEAAPLLRQTLRLRGGDRTAQRLLRRCEQRLAAARMGFA